jgi:hypothetical protein
MSVPVVGPTSGSAGNLRDHDVGHKVEVMGTLLSAEQAAKEEKSAGSAEKGESEARHQHLRVSSMSHIAATARNRG